MIEDKSEMDSNANDGDEQEKGKRSIIRYKRKNMELRNYEVWIRRRWGFSSKDDGFWRCAELPMEEGKIIMNTEQVTGFACFIII